MTNQILADHARAAKASQLADVLAAAGTTAATVPHLDQAGWTLAAQAAGVRAPSQATRDLVRVWLADREQPADDPFAGLADDLLGWAA